MIKKKYCKYLLVLPKFLMIPIKKLADARQKTMKDLLREAIEDFLKKNGIEFGE